jgi:hypothetical protein
MKLFTFIFTLFALVTSGAQQMTAQTRINALKAGVRASAYDKVQKYYTKHSNEIENKSFISFVDFSIPSTKERLFVINLKTGKVSKFLVTHGKRSGENMATNFSNMPESEKSSLGLYKIQAEYTGKHGKSLRLDGLENGLDSAKKEIPDYKINGITNGKNSNASKRAIVMHSADYATKKSIAQNSYRRLGRSQGCPAVSPTDWQILRPRLKNGSLLLMYR